MVEKLINEYKLAIGHDIQVKIYEEMNPISRIISLVKKRRTVSVPDKNSTLDPNGIPFIDTKALTLRTNQRVEVYDAKHKWHIRGYDPSED